MADPMAELSERFKAEALDRTGQIEILLDALPSAADPAAICDEIRDHAHKLNGAAGIFGFDEFQARAAEISPPTTLARTASSNTGSLRIRACAARISAAAPCPEASPFRFFPTSSKAWLSRSSSSFGEPGSPSSGNGNAALNPNARPIAIPSEAPTPPSAPPPARLTDR